MKRFFAGLCMSLFSQLVHAQELIILAAPKSNDSYYGDVEKEIINFHLAYAQKIALKDNVLVLTDKGNYDTYAKALGAQKVLLAPMEDIWMRDFTPVNPNAPLLFRYSAAAQGGGQKGQNDADFVQSKFKQWVATLGLSLQQTNLINDGGNFVEDGAGNAVLSKKFLKDNKLTEGEARQKLQTLLGLKNIAFIEADEQGGLQHSDGIVSFVAPNTLIMNSYPEDKDYSQQLKADLQRGLPNVTLHEIITPYTGKEIYDDRFGSACGLYTNALVTPERIYFPQFGISEDKIALQQIKAATTKEVIPINSAQVCAMGGGVRCMSWQLRGEAATKLLTYAASKN